MSCSWLCHKYISTLIFKFCYFPTSFTGFYSYFFFTTKAATKVSGSLRRWALNHSRCSSKLDTWVFRWKWDSSLQHLGVMCIIWRRTIIIMCNSYLSDHSRWFNQSKNECFIFCWELWKSPSCQLKSQGVC